MYRQLSGNITPILHICGGSGRISVAAEHNRHFSDMQRRAEFRSALGGEADVAGLAICVWPRRPFDPERT